MNGVSVDVSLADVEWRRQRAEDAPLMDFAHGVSGADPELNAEFSRSVDGEGFLPSWAQEGEDGERASMDAAGVFWDRSEGWTGEERTEMALVVAGLMVDPVGTLVRQVLSEDSFTRALIGEVGNFIESRMDQARELLEDALAGFSDNPQADVLEAREMLVHMEEEARSLAERLPDASRAG